MDDNLDVGMVCGLGGGGEMIGAVWSEWVIFPVSQ